MHVDLSGRCFCGEVRFRLTPPSEFASHCHCRSCRLSHAAPMVTWTAVPLDRFHLDSGQEWLRSYHSSPQVAWEFCSRCGSSLFYRASFAAEKIYVAAASLEALDRTVERHVSFEEHLPWMGRLDLPRKRGKGEVEFPGDGELRLRPVTRDDLGSLFQFQADPLSSAMAGVPSRDWQGFLRHWNERVLTPPSTSHACIEVDGAVAGHLVCWMAEDRRWLGYWLGRAWWGHGLAQRAVSLFLQQEQRRPLYAITSEGNAASQRVLEKAGFRRQPWDNPGERCYGLGEPGEGSQACGTRG